MRILTIEGARKPEWTPELDHALVICGDGSRWLYGYLPRSIALVPHGPHIGAGAERLYKLEDKRDLAIRAAAVEQGRVMGYNMRDGDRGAEYWYKALPEQLLSTLEAFERVSAEAAALAFLEKRGYKITREGA